MCAYTYAYVIRSPTFLQTLVINTIKGVLKNTDLEEMSRQHFIL